MAFIASLGDSSLRWISVSLIDSITFLFLSSKDKFFHSSSVQLNEIGSS